METSGITNGRGRGRIAVELLELRERILAQPESIRSELEPLIEEALEHARFRDRVLDVAKDALGRYRLDLEMIRFDLDATKRDHDRLVKRAKWGNSDEEGRLGEI